MAAKAKRSAGKSKKPAKAKRPAKSRKAKPAKRGGMQRGPKGQPGGGTVSITDMDFTDNRPVGSRTACSWGGFTSAFVGVVGGGIAVGTSGPPPFGAVTVSAVIACIQTSTTPVIQFQAVPADLDPAKTYTVNIQINSPVAPATWPTATFSYTANS